MSDATDDLVSRLEALAAEAEASGQGPELAPILARLAERLARVVAFEEGAVPLRHGMVGSSASMGVVHDLIARVAPNDVAVLIQGETGTGKELVARALHENSPRRSRPFLAENCAAVPANLLESELFGHVKGSFTGAIADRAGHFVAAEGGTVFLDEIGDMPLDMQAKLLRVLQDGELRPVGSNETRRVDVRVVAATNKDLPTLCNERAFREDLYFRLAVITIELPPLREREGDVAQLARHLLERFGSASGGEGRITPQAMQALEAYRWPGNVRELENEIQRALALSSGPITLEDLSPTVTGRD